MRTGEDALRSFRHFIWNVLGDDRPPKWQDDYRQWEIRLWGTEGEFGFPFARVAAITPENFAGSAAIRDSTRTFAAHVYPVPQATPEESIMEVERVEELLTVAFESGFQYLEPLMPPYSIEAKIGRLGSLAAGDYHYVVSTLNPATVESVAALGFFGTLGDGARLSLSWTEAVGAYSYNVYRTGPDGISRLLANTRDISFTDDGSLGGLPEAAPPTTSDALAAVETGPHRIPLYDYVGVPLDGPESVSYRRMAHDFLRVTQAPINRMTDPEDDRYWLITVEPVLTYRRLGRVPSAAPLVQDVRLVQIPG